MIGKKRKTGPCGESERMTSCVRLYWEFLKIGLFTIGGGMAMIPQIQQIAVNDMKWLTAEEMLDCIALSQSMPGVIAINSGTYIGRKVRGIRGSLAATAGVITPSFVIIILVVSLLGAIGENQYVTGAFTGIKAAVCGLILMTVVRMGRQTMKNVFQWALALASFAAIALLGINAVWAILAGAALGIIYNIIKTDRRYKDKTVEVDTDSNADVEHENDTCGEKREAGE